MNVDRIYLYSYDNLSLEKKSTFIHNIFQNYIDISTETQY